jgi:hypothetical protein
MADIFVLVILENKLLVQELAADIYFHTNSFGKKRNKLGLSCAKLKLRSAWQNKLGGLDNLGYAL